MTSKTITVEQFTKDFWEAQCRDIRRNLDASVSSEELDAHFPLWEDLDSCGREIRIKQVTEELLQPLYLAGYEIRRRVKPAEPHHD